MKANDGGVGHARVEELVFAVQLNTTSRGGRRAPHTGECEGGRLRLRSTFVEGDVLAASKRYLSRALDFREDDTLGRDNRLSVLDDVAKVLMSAISMRPATSLGRARGDRTGPRFDEGATADSEMVQRSVMVT